MLVTARTIKIVLDARLVGYWSDKHLYLGDMEGTDVAFRADGTGWIDWSNAGAFEILRFSWQAANSRPATLLEFDQPVNLGVTGNRFALERELGILDLAVADEAIRKSLAKSRSSRNRPPGIRHSGFGETR